MGMYCRGKKSVPVNTALYNRIKSGVKRKVKRWPSAYASGQVVRMYKKKGGKYSCSNKTGHSHFGSLDRWFKEKWVDVCTGKPCGRKKGDTRRYPYCRPSRRISSHTPKFNLTRSEIKKRCALKHRIKGRRLNFGNLDVYTTMRSKRKGYILNPRFNLEPSPNLKRIVFKNVHDNIKNQLDLQNSSSKQDICAICLEPLSYQRTRKNSLNHVSSWQPCGHTFHFNCMRNSLRSGNYNCPLCRTPYRGIKMKPHLTEFGKNNLTLNVTSTQSILSLREKILSTQPPDCLNWNKCTSWTYFISKPITNIKKIQFTLKRKKYTINKKPGQEFKEHIKNSKGNATAFYSPRGTLLVVPRKGYINLMDFAFNGSKKEWIDLWKRVAKETKKMKKPFYITTHGHSVNWLHIRLEKNIRF
jgi:hypothetical protein